MFESFRVSRRLKDLEESFESLDRRLKALEVEWADTLDRLKRMLGRIVKERANAEKLNPAREEGHLTDEQIGSGQTSLSDRQAEINARILARRNRSTQ